MKENLQKKIITYIIGLFIMAFGIVLIKKANLGMSPISTIPNALSNLLPFTLGNLVIAFQCVCIVLIILIERKVNWKTAIILPVAIGFGYIIDLYMFLLPLSGLPILIRGILCLCGIICTALGIVIIRRSEFVLPAPDELIAVVSQKTGRKMSLVKTCGDILWVVITLVLELLVQHRILSVGIGTIASMLLTGWFVGRIDSLIPKKETTEQPQPNL